MADMMNTLRSLLGDNADEKIQHAMNMLQSSGLLSQVQQGNNTANNSSGGDVINAINNDIQTAPPVTNQASTQVNSNGQSGTRQPLGNTAGAVSQAANQQNANAQSILTPEGMQFLSQIRGMVDQVTNSNDSRSNLLRSLRPFMRPDRQRSIDRAIRIMNIGRFSGLFGR